MTLPAILYHIAQGSISTTTTPQPTDKTSALLFYTFIASTAHIYTTNHTLISRLPPPPLWQLAFNQAADQEETRALLSSSWCYSVCCYWRRKSYKAFTDGLIQVNRQLARLVLFILRKPASVLIVTQEFFSIAIRQSKCCQYSFFHLVKSNIWIGPIR